MAILPTGKIKRIHVNQLIIRQNLKYDKDDPTLTVKCGKDNIYGRKVLINGPSELIQSIKKPLACGAKVWIETTSEVWVDEN